MKRQAIVVAGLVLVFVGVSACGGGDSEKDAVLGELRTQVEESGASQEYVDCIIDGLSGLGLAELESIRDETASDATNAVVDGVLDTCIPAEE